MLCGKIIIENIYTPSLWHSVHHTNEDCPTTTSTLVKRPFVKNEAIFFFFFSFKCFCCDKKWFPISNAINTYKMRSTINYLTKKKITCTYRAVYIVALFSGQVHAAQTWNRREKLSSRWNKKTHTFSVLLQIINHQNHLK